jgi:hypothetical protein
MLNETSENSSEGLALKGHMHANGLNGYKLDMGKSLALFERAAAMPGASTFFIVLF